MSDLSCPYCKGKAVLTMNSGVIYNGKDFGPVYLCENYPTCDSYVGCHPGNTKPLGRLADSQLRYWKKEAHKYFDQIWKNKKINKIYNIYISGTSNREKSYIWLSKELGLKKEDTHIGMFDVDTCKKVVEICKPHYE